MNNLIYNINENPKTAKEWILYAIQQVLAVFVATVLIAETCETPIASCLLGACVGTLIYQCITKFQSPMFISSCGATISAVIGALGSNATKDNYLGVAVGGLIICLVYSLFALLIKAKGRTIIDKLLPPIIIGPITMVIGLKLANFIPEYLGFEKGKPIDGAPVNCYILIAIFTMLIIASTSHCFKGFWKTIPFLIGLLGGYIISVIVTITGIAPIINFESFKHMSFIKVPDFSFLHWDFSNLSWTMVWNVAVMFIPVAVCAICEHYSDHKVLSNIIDTDLTHTPGLHRTLLGDGIASFVGTVICGLPNTSYGESIATVGFSRVASVKVISVAALILGALAFFEPMQIFIHSIPKCVFGGCAMILYGYIFASGLKTLMHSGADLENNKNLIIVSVIITVGISSIFLFNAAFAGVSLAMVLGVILNLILR